MPVVDFKTIFSTMAQPLVVAVVHVAIVLIVLLAFPLWILLAFKPAALERLAMQILMEPAALERG
jgi:hypothetical protein